jgi:uncharacterized protein YprB with RNaseH-like and TPR domain
MTTTIKELRCIHRHSIESHPACFAQGKVKYEFRDDAEFERVLGVPWYQHPDYRIGYLDIEVAGGFNADWGTMLTWCIKEREGKISSDSITRKEMLKGTTDRRITKSLVDEMRKYKILVGYYSTGFDIPYIRTKAVGWRIDFPGFYMKEKYNGNYKTDSEIYHWDLYYTIRNKFKFSRSSLANACDYFDIEGKTPISKKVWRKAMYGDKESLDIVLEHNRGDVEILEELHNLIQPFRKWTRKGI